MADFLAGRQLVRGDLRRKVNNALELTFTTGPDEPAGVAVQEAGRGLGAKMGVLFGFKNGGPGIHVLTGADGDTLSVESREQQPTIIRDGRGGVLAETEGPVRSTLRRPDGSVVFTVVANPEGAKTTEAFRMLLVDPTGSRLGTLDVIRTVAGWSLGRELVDDVIWFGHAGQPMKLLLLGTMLAFDRPPTPLEGDVALAVCVDLAIGMRPYLDEMN